jgi:hypothetical protein
MVDGLTTVGLALFTMPCLEERTVAADCGRLWAWSSQWGLALWAVPARPRVERLLNRLSERFPLVAKPAVWALRFVDGLAVLRSPVLLGRTLALTALAWTFSILEYWFALASVGVQLPPAGAAFSISAIGLSRLPAPLCWHARTRRRHRAGLWNVPAATALPASRSRRETSHCASPDWLSVTRGAGRLARLPPPPLASRRGRAHILPQVPQDGGRGRG